MNNPGSMNTYQDNVLVDSYQYTPVYLVQDPGAIQGHSLVVAQGNVEEVKPVTSNLKRFYENSGIFESNSGNNVTNISKPRILQRKDSKTIGNNLKLASFLMPKTTSSNIQIHSTYEQVQDNNVNKQSIPVNDVVVKPTVVSTNVINTVPKVEVDRKIVKLQKVPRSFNHHLPRRPHVLPAREKILPKIKPKDLQPIITNPIKHTSVQLLKLGETYHSLNQLSDDQMKMVNQALKIFNNPQKIATVEPTYDPVTNTRFIYKVVSPKDLTVVGKNKFVINNKKEKQPQQQEVKKEIKKEKVKPENVVIKKEVHEEPVEEPEPPTEVKVTRSGRKVKFPKQIVPDDTPQNKPRKRAGAVVSCFQCSSEFCSLYRLQKHYESHPTHLPAKVHSNLFHCLLAIVKSGSEENRSNIFIQQLEQLIEKLRSLLPCLLNKIDGNEGKSCTINDDIGRLFGMNAGKYNLNVDALDCIKDIDGNCKHNPPKFNNLKPGLSIPSPIWLNKQNDDNNLETEDCARINAVDKWPTTHKRLRNSKQQKSPQSNAKKMRLNSESADPIIELGIEDLVNLNHDDQSAINVQPKSLSILDELDLEVGNENPIDKVILDEGQNNELFEDSTKKCLSTETRRHFHSTHFDIRSSPIKSSSSVFRKFQINPEKLAKYDVQVIRPIELENKPADISEANSMPSITCDTDTPDLQSMFRDELSIELSPCKNSGGIPSINQSGGGIPPDLTFDTSKDWLIDTVTDKSIDSFIKTNSDLEPSLLNVQETIDNLPIENLIGTSDQLGDSDSRLLSSQSSSVLNFLESLGNECLNYPETEIRNNSVENVDFQLDLFSFNNT